MARGNFTNHHRKHPKVLVTCPCGVEFETTQGRIDAGRGKRCSKTCQYIYAVRPSGLTYELKKENPTSFKPGHVPWSTGTKGVIKSPFKGVKHGYRVSPETEFKPGHIPWNFKGDKVGYHALHAWLNRNYGRPNRCENADAECSPRIVQWANKTGEYKRDRDDWLHLCPRHHRRYDIENGLIGIVAERFS